jgi:diguanylate cyclase (GGDEF)-like protein/PAS domain S-box-containing protein
MPAASDMKSENLAQLRALLSAVGLVILVLVAHSSNFLKPLQYLLEDLRFAISSRPASDTFVVVEIDSESLAHIGSWPWKRGVYAEMIDALTKRGASDIALDIDFSSPSDPEEDRKLAHALERAGGNVILPGFKQAASASGVSGAFTISNLPIASFAERSWTASVNVLADHEGKVRRIALEDDIGGRTMPALAVMLAGHASEKDTLAIDFGIDPSTIDRVSAVDLFLGKMPDQGIRGKKVIIGATALELRDYVLVPVHGFISGALFHALAAESLLQDRALSAPNNSLMRIFLGFAGFIAGWLLVRRNWWQTLSCVAAASLGIELVSYAIYRQQPLLIDTSALQCLLAGTGLLALLQEIDLNKIKLWLARTEAGNLRSVLSQVVRDNLDGIIIADENGLLEAASAEAAKILGLPPNALDVGKPVQPTLPAEMSNTLVAAMSQQRDKRSKIAAAECVFVRDGDVRTLEYSVTPSWVKRKKAAWSNKLIDRSVACITFRDITEHRRLEQEAFALAHFDRITSLPNRNALLGKIRQISRQDAGGASIAVMVLDIDRFRSINRTLGYDYGDMLLRAVAARLSSLTAEIKFTSHLGGDDFAVLIGDWTVRDELSEIVELLILALNQPYNLDMRQLHVTFSAGVFICPQSNLSPVEAIMMADNALLASKQAGGGTFTFHEEVTSATLAHRQSIEVDLWSALDREQFSVFYQPQVDMGTGEIGAAEALLRWDHPSRGAIAPTEFIPIAEVTGMILPLGRWALQRACVEAAQWSGTCKLAVNVSVLQISRGDLIRDVETALKDSGLPPHRLELEVTESVFMQDSSRVAETIRRLQNLGISFSIDDFGTGYSSLSCLTSLPFNKLKIDRSLVRAIDQSEKSRAIVTAIISLARRLNIDVIAEGVENAAQAKVLQLLGCSKAQGFLFGKPRSSDQFCLALAQPDAGPFRDQKNPLQLARAAST